MLDPFLAKGQKAMCDAAVCFPAILLTRHPDRWYIPSDRDWLSTVDNFDGQFKWAFQASGKSADGGQVDAVLALTTGGSWTVYRKFSVGTLYHWTESGAHGSLPTPVQH